MDTSSLTHKRVLVTGAAGFIGTNLCRTLLEAGAEVTGVDNFLTGSSKNVDFLRSQSGSFAFIEADVIQSPTTYLPTTAEFDFIFHFASPASPPRYQKYPIETYLVNSQGTHELLQWMKNSQPQAVFVFAGTSEVYGDPEQHPQTEEYWGNVNPNGPRSCYDEAKRLGETICGVHARDFGMDVRIVRIFNTYGPHMDPTDGRVIPQFIAEALQKEKMSIHGDGTQTRSYCFVDDLVAGIIAMAATPQLAGETINLGNPDEHTIKETAEIIWQHLNPQSSPEFAMKPLPKDDPLRRRPDISKAQRLLSWQPKVTLETGLQKTIEYFRPLILS